MHISRRLDAVISMLAGEDDKYDLVADVGCDHGFTAISLITKGIAKRVTASDVRTGPLETAREHVAEYGFEDRIDICLSDGLEHISSENVPDAVILSGMGGLLICDIISKAYERQALPEVLILQPQSKNDKVRICLRDMGYEITAEDMLCEDGKFYVIIRGEARGKDGLGAPDHLKDIFGPKLIEDKNEVLKEYLLKEKKKYEKILEEMPADNEDRTEIIRKLEDMETVLDLMI